MKGRLPSQSRPLKLKEKDIYIQERVKRWHSPHLGQGLFRKGSTLVVLDAPLAGSLLLDIRKGHVPVVGLDVLDVLEGDSGHETLGLPCVGDLGVELVDLLEGKTLGLVDHAPDEEDADEAEATPDEEDLCAKVGVAWAGVHHVRSSTRKLLEDVQRCVQSM